MDRREFIAAASAFALPAIGFSQDSRQLRVGVIGHTGRGNFGHGLDTVWLHVPNTDIVGVADANETGLLEAKKRLRTSNGFDPDRS